MVRLLQLGELFALPLQSATRAQNFSLQETISFLEQFGLEEGVAKTFRLRTERMVEERTTDPETGIPETQFKVQPFELSIPLLAMVSPPSIQLQEMNVEFGVEIVEPRRVPIESSAIPSAVLGSSLAPSLSVFTPLSQSNPTTMKVNMKIVRETPEGMARLGDTLTDLLSGRPVEEPTVVAEPPTVIEEPGPRPADRPATAVAGIGPVMGNRLEGVEVFTVRDFLRATATQERVSRLVDILRSAGARRVSEKLVHEWRESALSFLREQE